MAASALPFDQIDKRLTFVKSGANVSPELGIVGRTVVRFFVTVVLYRTIKLQESLVSSLHAASGHFTAAEYEETARRLDSLTRTTEEAIAVTRNYKFLFNHDSIRQLEEQCERLDSLAESYHMSADEATAQYVDDLVAKATSETSGESWREFVASLHD